MAALYVFFIIIILLSAGVVIKRMVSDHRAARFKLKNYYTTFALFAVGIISAAAQIIKIPGLISWGLVVLFLVIGAWHTRHLQNQKE